MLRLRWILSQFGKPWDRLDAFRFSLSLLGTSRKERKSLVTDWNVNTIYSSLYAARQYQDGCSWFQLDLTLLQGQLKFSILAFVISKLCSSMFLSKFIQIKLKRREYYLTNYYTNLITHLTQPWVYIGFRSLKYRLKLDLITMIIFK
jgi:hypothetical protein